MTFEARSSQAGTFAQAPNSPENRTTSVAADKALWLDQHVVDRTLLVELLDRVAHSTRLQAVAVAGVLALSWRSANQVAVGVACLVVVALFAGAACVRRFELVRSVGARHVGLAWIGARIVGLAIGGAWAAALVMLLPGIDADRRCAVITIVVVLIAEGARYAAPRSVSIAYVAPICVGAGIGLAMSHTVWSVALALALLAYGWHAVVRSACVGAAVRHRIETNAVVAAQSDTIRTLLVDLDEETSDWLWRTDASGRITHISNSAANDVGAVEDATGRAFASLFARDGKRPKDGIRNLLAVMAAKRPFRNRLIELQSDQEAIWWRLSGEPLFDVGGEFLGYRGVGSDVSGARNSESKIAYLANFDPLTGFANRPNFQALAARQCAAAATDGQARALLCLDLDGFKSVNDTLGHEGGDELLKQVAARLTAAVVAGAVLARIGGDEFAIWVPGTTPARSEEIAKGLIEALRVPFEINGLNVEIGCSIGIALTPKHGTDADNLLMKADLALYRAKSEGRGCAKLFEEAFETSLIERRKLERDIKLALKRREFTLHYQPLVDANEGRVVCFEALIRWISPERGAVSPEDFVPVAEAAGLICALGRFVLSEACRVAAGWPQDVQLAVNLSPPHVRSSDFLQDVMMALKESGLHPSRLQIEVTEGVFLGRSDAASNALKTLRARGVKIALDDFGTGYSSLNYLVDFPVDKIKIDRAFIRDLPESEPHQAVVDAMLGLAKRLNIRVTAEGVETKEQAIALKRRRCDDLQGFLFSEPRPASDVPDMIAEVPGLFQHAIPSHLASPLAMALASRKPEAGQPVWA